MGYPWVFRVGARFDIITSSGRRRTLSAVFEDCNFLCVAPSTVVHRLAGDPPSAIPMTFQVRVGVLLCWHDMGHAGPAIDLPVSSAGTLADDDSTSSRGGNATQTPVSLRQSSVHPAHLPTNSCRCSFPASDRVLRAAASSHGQIARPVHSTDAGRGVSPPSSSVFSRSRDGSCGRQTCE
ncbi:hypothetical protein BC628DRAFT_1123432 [Trametes gibbosa]|nr:hypothetical protein BC628DRAFT_1123432 [Trametes gibbosa]